jgi:chloramphenicol-sensitive protein RarD
VFDQTAKQGAYFALSAYVFWGIVPIYFKWVDHVSAPEILIQRIIWSVVLLLGILAYTGQLPALRTHAKQLGLVFVSASLLATNWLIFISAIINENIVETSLGYFINPLVSVFLGMIFLGEKLRSLQWVAIAIAAFGIGLQLIFFGEIPWVALALAFSFGFYGLIRKHLDLPAVAGLALETLMVLPLALIGLLWLYQSGDMQFLKVSWQTDILLGAAGFVTTFPLLCFTAAVTRLSLTAAGMFQYIAPSLSLLVAVFLFNEPFTIDRQITFAAIWVALILFTVESLRHHQKLARQYGNMPAANDR